MHAERSKEQCHDQISIRCQRDCLANNMDRDCLPTGLRRFTPKVRMLLEVLTCGAHTKAVTPGTPGDQSTLGLHLCAAFEICQFAPRISTSLCVNRAVATCT